MTFEITADVDKIVADATDAEDFDVFAFVEGTNTPTRTRKLYTNADAAFRLGELKDKQAVVNERQKKQAEQLSIIDDDDEDFTYEIQDVQEELDESALTIVVKGLAPKALEALSKHFEATNGDLKREDEDEYVNKFSNLLVSKSIVKLVRSNGLEVVRDWTPEDVVRFIEPLYVSEKNKVYEVVTEANYVGAVFDAAVNAPF